MKQIINDNFPPSTTVLKLRDLKMWIKIMWLLIISFHLSSFYFIYFKHKYIVIMQFYSLFITKDFLEGVQGAGKGSSETWICGMHSIQCNLLKSSKTSFPVFLFICMLLFELYYSVEGSALQFSSTNIMPYSLSQASPEQITRVC